MKTNDFIRYFFSLVLVLLFANGSPSLSDDLNCPKILSQNIAPASDAVQKAALNVRQGLELLGRNQGSFNRPQYEYHVGTALKALIPLIHEKIKHGGKYETKALSPLWKHSDEGSLKFKYNTPEETKQAQAFFKDGKIYDIHGKLWDTRNAEFSNKDQRKMATYVMDENGNVYISNFHKFGVFHHSSFLKDTPLAAAGMIEIQDGKVVLVSNSSGHFQPNEQQFAQFIERLETFGTRLDDAVIEFDRGDRRLKIPYNLQ